MDTPQQWNLIYKIRPGTIDSGKEYETKIPALLSLNCVLHGVDEMWIAFNADDVGAFDDIILHVRTAKNDGITFMMQLKHKDNESKIQKHEFLNQKRAFFLKKYSEDISKLERYISSNSKPAILKHLGKLDNIYFVFFTNRGVYDNIEILQNVNDCTNGSIRFLKDVLNTSNTKDSLLGFNLETLPEIALKSNFDNVFLLANQLNSKYIDKQIFDRIKKIVDPSGLAQVDVKSMAQNFMQYVKDWARGMLGGHYCLTKRDVLVKISDLFLTHYAVNLRQHQFNFYDCNKKHIWNQIMCHETITVVDSNNIVLDFFVKYIGSEVRKHCEVSNENFWSENLSSQAQNLFYQTNQDLKEQMFKIIGNLGRITLLDVYKCLWMINKLPLLLEVKRIQDYENILNLLKFANYSYKVVVMNNTMENVPTNPTETKTFCTLLDLHSDYENAVLKLPIKLQGRAGVSLGNVIDENMYHYIKCSDIINILLNNFNIGNNLEQLPAYIIERSITKTFIKAQAVREIVDDIFLIDNHSNEYFSPFPKNDFNACKLEDVDFSVLNNYKVILLQEEDASEVTEKIMSVGKTVHYFLLHDQNTFQRKWSSGSTRNIKPFRIQGKKEYERDLTSCFSNTVNIISDTAGMGKSTIMDYIQHKAPTNKWVIRVNLNSHQKYFQDCRTSDKDVSMYLRYFTDKIFTENCQNSELSRMVFDKLLHKDVIVLLDGFDEVSYSHETEVLKMAKCLYLEGYQIWLTTRPHMQLDLEEKFETFSISLKLFSVDDQHQFLIKFFSVENSDLVLGSEFLVNQFVEKLLRAARKNLNDLDATFTGIPLQGKLLAEVFNEDCRNYILSKGTICFNETFDLVYLYQNFIDKKINIVWNKFKGSAIDLHNMFKKHQLLFALKFLYPYQDFIKTYVDKELDEHYKREPSKFQLLQRDGIITVDEKLNISCTHQTFAEFLVATWFSENINSKQADVKKFIHYIVKDEYRRRHHFFISMLNRLLVSNNCPAHLAIINGQIEKAKELIRLDFNSATKMFDRCGRSVLHIIAYCSVQLCVGYKVDQHFTCDDMLDIINIIPDDTVRELGIKQDLLGYNPLDYALLNHSFGLANWICNKIETITINASSPFSRSISFYCNLCLELNFQSLFKVLLPCAVYRDLLMKVTALKSDVFNYLNHNSSVNNVDGHFVHSYKETTLLQVMQSEGAYPYSGFTNGHYSDLRFAAVFGTKQNVLKLLSEGIEINQLDHNNNTPLHYAVLHGKLKIIKTLLLNGANINTQGYGGNTPLHLAVYEHISITDFECFENPYDMINYITNKQYYYVVAHLLKKGADINKQNLRNGQTPLHYLLFNMNDSIESYKNYDKRLSTLYTNNIMDLVKLLISNGADVNTKNGYGETVIHPACEQHFNDFVVECLPKINDIDQPDQCGTTPLHIATRNGYCDLVKILLLAGANINKQDNDGCTPLHLAKTRKVATLLIAKGANIHLETKNGETALHRQASDGRVGIVNKLLQKGLEVNKQTNNGDTALCLATKNDLVMKNIKFKRVIELLLAKGANVNIKNASGRTPLNFGSSFTSHDSVFGDKCVVCSKTPCINIS